MNKKNALKAFLVFICIMGAVFGLSRLQKEWSGVDDTVVGKFAREAGHPAWRPFIDTEKGDLLLFCFLVAGASGGFLAGYSFREVFPPDASQKQKQSPPR